MENNRFVSARRQALSRYFKRLNDMQKKAVFTVEGPVLILAGAGSGKTSVLVNRIANMVNFGDAYADENCPAFVTEDDISFLESYDGERDEETVSRLKELIAVNTIDAWRIMAITFTNKAAGELKERLADMLGNKAEDITAATFHSVCVRILRREIDRLGYEKNFTIYDSDDSQRLLKSCYDPLDLSDKTFPPKAVLSAISHAKDSLITPEEFEEQAGGDYRLLGYAKLYKLYQERLKSANAVDFDDIINLTVRLFEQEPEVLDHYSNRYRYIMVDEYQDTNYAQLKLVTLLSQKYNNICVVGDDDQSIYKFRGATIENILKFTEQFDGATAIRLEQNYRSTQNILNAANSVISNNTARNAKQLWTDTGDGEKIVLYKASDESAESRYVASTILEGVQNGAEYRDFAVLYRMNAQSNSLERAFTASGIPYKVIGGQRFYDRKEIKDMIAYLAVLNNDRDMLRFKRIINEPKRGLGDSTVAMIEQMSSDMGMSPIDVMSNAADYPILSKKSAALKKTADMFIKLKQTAETEPLDVLLDELLDVTGYRTYMENQGDEGAGRLENIAELKSTMVEYMESKPDGDYSLSEFLEEISLYTDVDKMTDDENVVCMMTVHSAKGLEFPTVFMVGLENGIFPSTRSTDTLEDLEEERRLAYVAITRAKKKLHISYAQQRMLFGSTNRNMVSRFIKEIPAEYIERVDGTVARKAAEADVIVQNSSSYTLQSQLASKRIEQAKKAAASSDEYTVGEKILHGKFGEGTILSVKKMSNDSMLEIAFETVGTKKVMANFAKLKKLN
ncbi:MAG: UvrD-helicase domain-containing protein [Oscillospiraceae bacterium]|nr:UvrD-helicase domain-containing protein [Oscillospiraceae bacterium]